VNSYESAQLDALGDSARRAILGHLMTDGPIPVGELARKFPISRPAISQHLRILTRANLVTNRTEGRRRLYFVKPEAMSSLRACFERFSLHARIQGNL